MNRQQFGGTIGRGSELDHIISIGYEFETSDFSKFSLTENDVLINTNHNALYMTEDAKYDDNNYMFDIALGIDLNQARSYRVSSTEHPSIASSVGVTDMDPDNSFVEYMEEPRPKDGNTVKVAVANDVGATSFTDMLEEKCKGRPVSKNELYAFKTEEGRTFPIAFSDAFRKASTCGVLS